MTRSLLATSLSVNACFAATSRLERITSVKPSVGGGWVAPPGFVLGFDGLTVFRLDPLSGLGGRVWDGVDSNPAFEMVESMVTSTR